MRVLISPIPTSVPVVIFDAESRTVIVDERLSPEERLAAVARSAATYSQAVTVA